jgi:hypothetical protein
MGSAFSLTQGPTSTTRPPASGRLRNTSNASNSELSPAGMSRQGREQYRPAKAFIFQHNQSRFARV